MASKEHVCPKISFGMMPMIIAQHATRENVTEVLDWIKNGGDINASDLNGQTLVHMAISNSKNNLLRELIKVPNVHLNQHEWPIETDIFPGGMIGGHSNRNNIIILALNRNNWEGLEIILSSTNECKIDLKKNTELITETMLNTSRRGNGWKLIEILLEAGFPLTPHSAKEFLNLAIKARQVNVVKHLLDRDTFTSLQVDDTLLMVYDFDMWALIDADVYFQRAVEDNDLLQLSVLKMVLNRKDWKTLEKLLQILTDDVKIDIGLCEVLLSKKVNNIEQVLTGNQFEDDVMNGAILVAAIKGITEELAEKLLSQKEKYPQKVLDYALILTLNFKNFELVPILLKKFSFSYGTLHRTGRTQDPLIARALKKISVETILSEEKCEENNTD